MPQHLLAELTAHQKRPGEVHLKDAPPVGDRGLLGGRYEAHPGIVDQDVYPTKLAHHGFGHPAHRPFVGDVTGEGEGRGAGVPQFPQGTFRRGEIVCGYPIALFGEGEGDLAPDAAGGAGYEGDAIPQGQSVPLTR